jgi:hypothetical protein
VISELATLVTMLPAKNLASGFFSVASGIEWY